MTALISLSECAMLFLMERTSPQSRSVKRSCKFKRAGTELDDVVSYLVSLKGLHR